MHKRTGDICTVQCLTSYTVVSKLSNLLPLSAPQVMSLQDQNAALAEMMLRWKANLGPCGHEKIRHVKKRNTQAESGVTMKIKISQDLEVIVAFKIIDLQTGMISPPLLAMPPVMAFSTSWPLQTVHPSFWMRNDFTELFENSDSAVVRSLLDGCRWKDWTSLDFP